MGYFTRTASQLGAAGKPLRWTTPDGLQVVQSYRHKDVQRFQSANLGRLRIMTVSDRIDARKAGSGAAPQVVHSLDAAMLRMVAVRLSEGGIDEMAMIHDSYGVAAGHVDQLNQIIRECAVDIFSGNWLLDSFHAGQLEEDPSLAAPPDQGALDVASELPRADYFFS